jgi:hypothetical protein
MTGSEVSNMEEMRKRTAVVGVYMYIHIHNILKGENNYIFIDFQIPIKMWKNIHFLWLKV